MTTNKQTTLADRCARCDCAESGAPDAQAMLADARAQVEEARRERDVREALVQQYRAQHDAEAQRRGCPFCTCDVCAAAMRRTVVSERDLPRARVACAADLLAEERNRLRGQSESWRRAAVAWQEWASRLTGDAALGDEAARAAVSGRVAELEAALRWMADRNLLRIIPPALADRLLRRRAGRWLLRDDASGVLAACPDEGCTGSEAKCSECRRGGGR